MTGSRAARLALVALCALGPAVFAVKAVVRPGGDVHPKPAAVKAVPVILLTLSPLVPADLAGPRAAQPMPALSELLRDGILFPAALAASDDPAAALVSVLTGSLASSHGVSSASDRIAGDFPTLAVALRRAGFRTLAVRMSSAFTETGLSLGFETFRELPGSTPSGAVAELDALLGEETPARFLAWLDLRVPPGDGARVALDDGVRALHGLLARRRIQGDCVVLTASVPAEGVPQRTGPDGLARPVLSVRLPYEYRATTQVPASVSAIDLAPLAVEVVQAPVPPRWTGRSRTREIVALAALPGAPAVAGPFGAGASAEWVAEEWPVTVFVHADGSLARPPVDRARPGAAVAPPALVEAARAAALATTGGR